ncbi:uncharacterized protein ASPGLDRAFT_84627 [Aspergillus glaucus CBS 516.65]|uniref:Uncharacterized protein n=1 Tax=Aspergillus glaucus CBS 516.65 TaxID=1160497 RepID=A0A1L9VBC2_ASPGL|nr:hypothetical protein ASPGLDRAFT_84627 [Aspergillus glaucus CBS 516.65]OJJ81200.1 hypothetical protein ASPGLDRAFT_84627 [Aspergillus glaucus CBS 516.65]
MVNPDDWNLARDLFEHADSDNEFSGFDNLHRFSIETEDIETGIAACSEYGSVFSMAKEVQIVHINDIDMSPSKMQPHSSPIEHLYILEGEMGPEAMRVFIQSCRTLRAFNYTYGKIDIFEEHFRPLEAVQLLLGTKSGVETPDLVNVLPGVIGAVDNSSVTEVRVQQFPNLKKVGIGFCQEAMERNVELQMEGVELTMLYQSKPERAAYVYDREGFSWLGSPVFRP